MFTLVSLVIGFNGCGEADNAGSSSSFQSKSNFIKGVLR